MTISTLRLLRQGLVVLVLATVGAVVWSLRRPQPPGTPPTTVATPETPPPGAQSVAGFHYEQHKGDPDRVSFVLDAQNMVGQEQREIRLKGVTMTFPYLARGEEGTATVTSDDCTYTPGIQKAVFQGHVVVKTKDGGELTTDSLVYRGDRGAARTDAPAQFKRGRISGSATGMVYDAEQGELKLLADAFLRIEDEKGGPPLEIRSQRAVAKREEGAIRFEDDVSAHAGNDTLAAEQLVVSFDTSDESLVGATAVGDVELKTPGGRAIPGMGGASRGKGPRTLTCKHLDVSFKNGHTVQVVEAAPDGELTILPGPGEPRERRVLKAKVLTFRFDDEGRLEEVQGQRDSSFVTDAIPPARAVPRSVTCRSFVAKINPETSQTETIDFSNDVEITRGTQRSRSQRAWYQAKKSRIALEQDPEMLDLEDGSRLQAHDIEIATETGNVVARGEVTHVLGKQASSKRPGLLRGEEAPAVATCRRFEHEVHSHTTRYLVAAVLRSGKDEIRAPMIRLREGKDGKRRLFADEGVVSLFHPHGAPGKPPPAPVETRAKQLYYDEATSRAVYIGDVVIRQGDLLSKSPEATVTFTPDGSQVQSVMAGEPVEITQGARKATGKRGTYTPATEIMVLVGERVVLEDAAQQVHGRSLTFHVGDDRILVDGREEARTETILKKEPPKP